MNYITIPVTPYQQNCSLIWCEETKKAAFIDPGGEMEKLVAALQARDLVLEKVLLTHGHLDHVGAAKEIADQFNVPIVGPQKDDEFWFKQLPKQAQMFNFPHLDGFLPSHWIEAGESQSVGNIRLETRHCPGHTPGHIIFYNAASKLAFVGDILFNGSVGRSDFPQGNHETLINSIKTQLLPLGDGVVFVPGHGPNSTFGHERLHNPFLQPN